MTECGKTELAKQIAAARRAEGRGIIVLDPQRDVWESDQQFSLDERDAFLDCVWRNRDCDVFVDEAGIAVGQFDKVMTRLATEGRHWGHNCYFLVQRAAQISPSVRGMCRKLFAFNQQLEDCDALRQSWGQAELMECVNLAQFEYLYTQRFKDGTRAPVERGRVIPSWQNGG